ncbi:MAG: type II toxin-antitoxin system RelE/ParE family toxin [Methylacidiphilales bacterium]|nr:type II toxin-antitoxin system RelE/ParE family toxin [Candidatus Methylacidiphilales bacterium]
MEHFQVKFTKTARRDLEQIRAYIAEASADEWTADRFCGRLLDTALSLDVTPDRGAKLHTRPDTRFLVLRPYLVFYRILEEENIVLVLRFWHGAQHPKRLRLK